MRHCNGAARSFGEKEKFLTSAYKKKLIEDQKWDEEMRRCYQPHRRRLFRCKSA